jgi:hypothetical protein
MNKKAPAEAGASFPPATAFKDGNSSSNSQLRFSFRHYYTTILFSRDLFLLQPPNCPASVIFHIHENQYRLCCGLQNYEINNTS